MADASVKDDALRLWLDAAVIHPADQITIHLLQNDVLDSLKSGAAPVKRVINQTLAAATRSQSRATEAALRTFIIQATNEVEGFAAAFAGVFSARAKTFAQSFASARLIVLRLSCAVVEAALKQASDVPAWVSDVAKTQSVVLEAMLKDSDRVQAFAHKAVLALLKNHAALVPIYVSVLTEAAPEQQQYALWLLLRRLDLDAAVHERAWKAYAFWAFEAKNRTLVALKKNDLRFQGLTLSQFDELIKPTLSKMLKKSPDSALEAVIETVRAVPLDLGGYLDELFTTVLLSKLKSTKEDVRAFTITLAKELLEGFQSADHIVALVSQITAMLDGKHGLLAQFYMRESCFAVLADAGDAIVSLGSAEDAKTVAAITIPSLVKALEKEAQDQTRHLGLLALGKWLSHANSISQDVLAKLQAGLKNKSEAVVAGYLRAAAVFALQAKGGVAPLAPLASELSRIAAESNKKPTIAHLDGVLAVGLAGTLALSSSQLDQALTKDGVASVLLDTAAFLLPSVKALLTTLAVAGDNGSVPGRTKPEVTALVALTQALTWVLSSQQADATAAYRVLVELLVAPVLPVRKAAERAVASVYASSLVHADGLLLALQTKLAQCSEQLEKEQAQSLARKPSSVADDAPATSVAVVPPAGVLRRALRSILPPQLRDADAVRSKVFARALVLAHHPFVVDGAAPAAFRVEWDTVKTRLLHTVAPTQVGEEAEEQETTDDRIDHLLEADERIKETILALLAAQDAGLLWSTLRQERVAAQRALATLLEFAGNGEGESLALHDVLEDALVAALEAQAINEVTEDDAALYEAPADEIFVAKKPSGDASEVSVASRRGGGGARRGNEDEQWEQQVREELERKKAKAAASAGATKKLSAEDKALLAQQQARRQQLQRTLTVVDRVVETVAFVARTRPDEVHPALPRLLQALRPLSGSRLFTALADAALDALALAISPVLLREHASDVAASLRVVLRLETMAESTQKELLATHEALWTRTLAALMALCFGFQFDSEDDYDAAAPVNQLAPPTLHLVLPVLRCLLEHGEALQLRRWALPLLAAHAHVIAEEDEEEVGDVAAQRLLREPMLSLALRLLAKTAAGDMLPIEHDELAPAHLLARLCEGDALSPHEWAPLLGDGGLLAEADDVRHACLLALRHVAENGELEGAKTQPLVASRLFLACWDGHEPTKALALHVWQLTDARVTKLFAAPLLALLSHAHAGVRASAARALADGMTQYPETTATVVATLQAQFLRHVPSTGGASMDAFGNPTLRRAGQPDPLEEPSTYLPRCGVAQCLEEVAAAGVALTPDLVVTVVGFVIAHGLVDAHASVRAQMRKTGIQVIDAYGGGRATSQLLALLETALDQSRESTSSATSSDHQREGVVVCLGALAKHMDPSDPKVAAIVDALLDALTIPSESVQRSVATCLAPLVPAVKPKSGELLTTLLTRATSAETFGERMGAAFGVSAIVKGLGIAALKQHDVLPRIEDLMKAGGATARQGAMLIFERLSERLALLFEPYIIVILPTMLKCFADASPLVRDAATQTSQTIMANLSAHGVKLVLPALLRSMEDGAWRTKQAGIQLLGAMAYCAPRQLGSCLPLVVPKITAALTDSHPKVRDASQQALKDVGSVVRNPEIASIAPALLHALQDPTKFTGEALQQLQSTTFQHSIDAPSLALVMPIITRGLKERGGDAKKKAARIVGAMCSMIHDAKDLAPYMDMVRPSLQSQLLDPIPEVRAVAAKALGKLVKGLGEHHFQDLLAWLLDAIKAETGSSVERAGAAQGLCEVLVALGKDRVEATVVDDLLPLARHPKASVREGVLWVLAFLPPALGKGFSSLLGDALPVVVAGLSDEHDAVRDVAMHAGHVVVNAHALSHTKEILPALEDGLFDDSWRIRQSAVTLLGDLMYRISGTKATAAYTSEDPEDHGAEEEEEDEDEEEDTSASSAAGDRAIIKTLGLARRNAILASLYLIRSDTSAAVRQSALHVWKSVVGNTPKTLRQLLPTLMHAIVAALAGDHVEKQTMAGRTLGEIVRKLGDSVLPAIVPILRDGLRPENAPGQRQGACVGLAAVIECCTKKQLEDFVTTLVDALLDGLCDALPSVRAAAAQAFDSLHKNVGYRAIDETVPALLARIKKEQGDGSRALDGLAEILRLKAKEVLPYLVPRLLATPVVPAFVRALPRVAQATGGVIHFHLEKMLLALVPQYVAALETDPALAAEIQHALQHVLLAVHDSGVHWLAAEVCKLCESDAPAQRTLALGLVAAFVGATATDYSDHVPLFLRQIVTHLNDSEPAVVQQASAALLAMNSTQRPEQLMKHIDFIRHGLNALASDARHRKGGVGAAGVFVLPGLAIAKGLEPFLPAYQYALMNGSPEQRQSAALGLGELVQLAAPAVLKPYLVKLTGPLIRVAGDRFPGHVKAAILHTLELIVDKGGVFLKPFLPQLQTTFVKALHDAAAEVRGHGTTALAKLVALSPRIDPLVAELTDKLQAPSASGGVREANLDALTAVLQRVGDKVSSAVRSALVDALVALLLDGGESEDTEVRERAAKCLAVAIATDSDSAVAMLLQVLATSTSHDAWQKKQAVAATLEHVLGFKPSLPEGFASAVAPRVADVLTELGTDEHVGVRSTAVRAIAALVKLRDAGVGVDRFVALLAQGLAHLNKDVAKTCAKIAKRLAKQQPEAVRGHLAALVPPTFTLIKSNNLAAKLAAERALLYLLQVQSRPETVAEYARVDAVNGKIVAEYARRVLAKLKPDSGDESE